MKADRKESGHDSRIVPKGRRERGPSKADIESCLALLVLTSKPRRVIRVLPGTKPVLRFNEDERRLILDNWSIAGGLTDGQLKALEKRKRPWLSMLLADWEEFGGRVAATGNHAREGSKLQSRADPLSDRIQFLLDSRTEETD